MINCWSIVYSLMLGGECTCTMTSKLANQCAPKALFACVAYANTTYYCLKWPGIVESSLVKEKLGIMQYSDPSIHK